MYRRPKFLEILLEIRQEMAREADYDVDLFAEMVRSDKFEFKGKGWNLSETETVKIVRHYPVGISSFNTLRVMEIAFDAIGIEIANQTAFDDLAENVGTRGELSRLRRDSGILLGRCLKLGEGLEVWSVRYESETGDIFPADCRPAFRAKYTQKISPWLMTEFDREGEAVIHGFIENSEAEVLFELQNLTEIGSQIMSCKTLQVGLCGLAYRAEIFSRKEKVFWKTFEESTAESINDNDWSLCGRVLEFSNVRNSFSGSDLYWIYLDLGEIKLEILVNQRALEGGKLKAGTFLKADIWLQGHILNENIKPRLYEGVDRRMPTIDFLENFQKAELIYHDRIVLKT